MPGYDDKKHTVPRTKVLMTKRIREQAVGFELVSCVPGRLSKSMDFTFPLFCLLLN